MVSDHLRHAEEYFNLSPGIRRALEFLRQADLDGLTPGRHDIDGDQLFVLVSDYDTRRPEETFWESHRRHVDVQYVHRGRERIGIGEVGGFVEDSYDSERDLIVQKGDSARSLQVDAGHFVILFPHDVHMPGLTADAVQSVRKLVVKVRRN